MLTRLASARPMRRRAYKHDLRSQCTDQSMRARVVLKFAAGRSCNWAERELGCVPSTAVHIVAPYRREGEASFLDGRMQHDVRKLDADVRGGVARILTRTPKDHGHSRLTWTLEILRGMIATVLGVAL